jgi:hypothetical protein
MQVYFETVQILGNHVLVWLLHPHRMLIYDLNQLRARQQEALQAANPQPDQKNFILHPPLTEYKMLQSPMDSKMPIFIQCHPNESITTPIGSFGTTSNTADYFVLSHEEMNRIIQTVKSVLQVP